MNLEINQKKYQHKKLNDIFIPNRSILNSGNLAEAQS